MIRLLKNTIFYERWWRYLYQRWTRGWDDSDTWSLDQTAAKFILPRLKRFREVVISYPQHFTPETWDEALGDMIYALETAADDDARWDNDRDWDRVNIGFALFGQYFMDLWS